MFSDIVSVQGCESTSRTLVDVFTKLNNSKRVEPIAKWLSTVDRPSSYVSLIFLYWNNPVLFFFMISYNYRYLEQREAWIQFSSCRICFFWSRCLLLLPCEKGFTGIVFLNAYWSFLICFRLPIVWSWSFHPILTKGIVKQPGCRIKVLHVLKSCSRVVNP